MKKHLHLLLVGAFALFAFSSLTAQIRFGVDAGFNAAKVNYRVFPGLSPKMVGSFQVSGVAEFPLPVDLLYLEVGLGVQGKGYQYVVDSSAYKISGNVNPLYVQVPVKLIVRSSDGGVFGGIGPYLAYGVAGKVKEVTETFIDGNKVTTTDNVQFGNTTHDHFLPFDYGVTLELGYEFDNGVRVIGAYSWGLGDSRKDAIKGTKFISPINHRVASLGVTYFFYEYKR